MGLLESNDEEFTGYAIDDEDLNAVANESVDFDFESMPMRGDVPAKYDPRTIPWRVENQGRVGRCAGMAASSVGEMCFNRQSAGQKIIHFNGHASYIWAQKNSRGLYGRDAGSTIHGNVKAAKQKGFCPIDWSGDGRADYPLPPRYTTNIPAEAEAHAAKYKIGYSAFLETFDAVLNFLRSGQGAVMVGGSWGRWSPNADGIADRFRSGGSGHAWMICGWDCSRKTYSDDLLIAVNSHGERSWKKGFCFLTRRFVKDFSEHKHTVIAGMSDLSDPEPRKVNWETELVW